MTGISKIKSPVGQTQSGYKFKRTHVGLIAGTLGGLSMMGRDLFLSSTVKTNSTKLLKSFAILPIGIIGGLIVDTVVNKIRANNFNKKLMPLDQKFFKDINSKNYVVRYNAFYDDLTFKHKKDVHNKNPKHNVYRASEDGTLKLIDGKDFRSIKEEKNTENKDVFSKESLFIENNETIKQLVKKAKLTTLFSAQMDKNYGYHYDKEKDAVILCPEQIGINSRNSFVFRSDGSVSIISPVPGSKEKPIKDINGMNIFDKYANEVNQ